MCGFIGRINYAAGAAVTDPPPLESGMDFLRRRGPDSSHYWRSTDGRVELIQARLAIVDPDSRADLPFSEPRYGLTAIFNGEVYNYEEVRRELGDHPFRTCSDTEVLLAAVARWGVEGLKRLRGMFSCVLVDERNRRVVLARDPVGKKPLFVAHWPGGVLFGSSLLPLAAAVPNAPPVRPEVLRQYWERGYIPAGESVFAGARPLGPGEVLELDWDGKVRRRTDCFPKPAWTPPASFEEAREQVGRLLADSVRKRLHNNPEPVSLLSGGIDSTVVTAWTRAAGKGSAITLGSLLPFGQDEKYARYAAWRCGVPLEILRTQLGRLEEDVAWALDLQDEPLGMISFFLLSLLLRTAKTYGKILLTGDGGDEVFLGYGRQPADWTDASLGAGDYTPADQSTVVGAPAPEWMSPWGRYTVGASLLGHMFTKLDRASAEQGVEVRCPLLDWDLLTYVRSAAPAVLFHGGSLKALLKAQLPQWPHWFLNRPKIGFAYHLRWAWGLRSYAGLREMVAPEAVEAFGADVPARLRRPPRQWRSWDILRNFPAVWKILAWSRFLGRLNQLKRPPAVSLELSPERRNGSPVVRGQFNCSTGSGIRADVPRTGRAAGATPTRGRVCIVTPGPVSCNPRVVKEADALAAAGYSVRVVGTQHTVQLADWDRELVASRAWRYEPILWAADGWRARARRWQSGARQALFRELAGRGVFREPVAELANGRLYRELLAAVCRSPADLISAHYVPALPVACRAAKRFGAPVAFDAEDDHVGEFPEAEAGSLPARLVYHLEAKYLPRCCHVTAASDGIARALAERYWIARPTAIHNVFPWAERGHCDGLLKDRRGPALSLVWYSQVVGLDRGLQDAVRATGLLRGDFQLHVRGRLDAPVRRALEALAGECGTRDRLYFHAPVHPNELLARTAEHDVGLALEQPVSPNRLNTCTNKIFFYMLAELAIVATATPGQRPVMESSPEAGYLYPPGDYRALAAHLQRLIDTPELVRRAKRAALAAARERWNWERESQKLLALVEDALGRSRRRVTARGELPSPCT